MESERVERAGCPTGVRRSCRSAQIILTELTFGRRVIHATSERFSPGRSDGERTRRAGRLSDRSGPCLFEAGALLGLLFSRWRWAAATWSELGDPLLLFIFEAVFVVR